VVARFIDIGGIDGHHCLKFLLIINLEHGNQKPKPDRRADNKADGLRDK